MARSVCLSVCCLKRCGRSHVAVADAERPPLQVSQMFPPPQKILPHPRRPPMKCVLVAGLTCGIREHATLVCYKFVWKSLGIFFCLESVNPDQMPLINPLMGTGNYSATSNNVQLVHWPLIGGLLHLVQR